jgi:hypothetical protein
LLGEEVVLVQHTRQDVINLLRRAGFYETADKALAELPDPVDIEYAIEWAARHGITKDLLISQMGGSP